MVLWYYDARCDRPTGLLEPLALILMIIAAAGCGASGVPLQTEPAAATHAPSEIESRIRSEYIRWQGTPHVIGGQSAHGMDCSAYVQRVFGDAFDLDLPRTTEAQVKEGQRIARRNLQPGDLVFFLPSKTRHVGIYLGNGEFTHASSSSGVTTSELNQPYWRDSYWTSRRVLPDASSSSSSPGAITSSNAPAVEDATVVSGRRVGW